MVDTIIQLTEDKGVIKKIIKEGEDGATPEKGQEVLVNYTGRLEDGTVFDSSENKEALRVIIGVG
jgi:peptidylprolyl isomerase